ncbi:hypothetical protein [Cyanobium sp. WAJ14-Wanaka]|uniref:hypothetical protein n=1 Tax=Cyanobium sp. WAJ14-Wanaka TaxID=2823725 RepID=UPI0020CC771E|nr:hypothetical protein [Cyanobium sp. WAJ14-Wanaka]
MPYFSAHGLLLSSDLVLPELREVEQASDQELVSIGASDPKRWPGMEVSSHSTPALQLGPAEWRLELEGIGWFRALAGTGVEWARWDDSVSDRDLRTFLVTSGLGAVAIQRGRLALHGTALQRDGQAVLLLGRPAAGKSTLAWCLLQQGWQLLSSELVVVDRLGQIWPGMQQIKLWHDAAVALGIDWQELPAVRRGLKRYALLPRELPQGVVCAQKPVTLRCIYQLAREREETPNPALTASKSFSQQGALLALRNQMFHARMVRGMGMEQELFLQAAQLARTVPVHRLRVADGIKAMAAAVTAADLLDPASLMEANDG